MDDICTQISHICAHPNPAAGSSTLQVWGSTNWCGSHVQRPSCNFASSSIPWLRWTWFLSLQNTERGPVKGRCTNLCLLPCLVSLGWAVRNISKQDLGFPQIAPLGFWIELEDICSRCEWLCVADLLLSEMDTKRRRHMDSWGMEQAETEPSWQETPQGKLAAGRASAWEPFPQHTQIKHN